MNAVTEAKKGRPTPAVELAAKLEGVPLEAILQGLADGTIVVPANRVREVRKPCGIGRGLRVKVNANLGTSPQAIDYEGELEKVAAAVAAGADTVMDLSTGG
ncbi:MAG: phosphomethylpyrimidine synthase ThiC, partial [Candidatus Erginobacter occultus]|nr:phosphomethylpyrimidine synthase ThiC [Candidatus Erginobacter occultus]